MFTPTSPAILDAIEAIEREGVDSFLDYLANLKREMMMSLGVPANLLTDEAQADAPVFVSPPTS